MRILHLTRDFPPRCNGGVSTAVGGLVGASRRAGLGVAIASFDDWRPARAASSTRAPGPRVEAGLVRVTALAQLAAVRDLARRFAPDVVHVHDAMLWDVAVELGDRPRVFSVHVDQRAQDDLRGTGAAARTLGRAAQERAIAEADRVVAPSRAVAAALVAADSRVAARLRVAGVGVDDTDEAQAATARRRATDEGPVLCAGRFADVKGTGDLASLVPRLAARGGGAHVVVAGGVPGNRRADARWRRRLAATGAELCGWLDAGALAAQYARARVLVVPSRAETFGLVAVEGMLHGLPVVATAAGGLVEIVEHDHTGLVCPPGDVEAIATAVGALLDDGARALRLGQTAARVVRERHLWAYVLPAWIAIYRSAQG